MPKFTISLNQENAAKQVALLLNSNNKLKQVYTSSKVLTNNITYCLELGGYNEKDSNMERKVIGVIGYSNLSRDVVIIRHLCVDLMFRNQGIATSLIKQVINSCPTNYIQIRVRHDNLPCLNLTERLGFVYIYHETMSNYYILVLGRRSCQDKLTM